MCCKLILHRVNFTLQSVIEINVFIKMYSYNLLFGRAAVLFPPSVLLFPASAGLLPPFSSPSHQSLHSIPPFSSFLPLRRSLRSFLPAVLSSPSTLVVLFYPSVLLVPQKKDYERLCSTCKLPQMIMCVVCGIFRTRQLSSCRSANAVQPTYLSL